MTDIHHPRNRGDSDAPPMSPVTPPEDAHTIILNRISWGAVLAGVAVTLVSQLTLNLRGLARCPTLPGFPYLMLQPRSRFRECAPNQQRTGFAHPEHEGHAVDEDHGGRSSHPSHYRLQAAHPP
jgi:hypothetical protein